MSGVLTYTDVNNLLPSKWQSEIIENSFVADKNVTKIRFLIPAKTVDEVKQWVYDYEQMHKLTYSIRSSEKGKGCKVVYKVRLQCHHNTKCNRTYSSTSRNRTKNTNCFSSIAITLHAERLTRKYQGQNKLLLHSDMRCEVCLIPDHNHNTECSEALKFRRVSEGTISTLTELFKNGHTPATALEIIKADIYLNNENPDLILADRTKYGPLKMCKEYIQDRVDKFNKLHVNSALVEFEDENYVICICTPLMRRVHKYVTAAREIVFMDSTGTLDTDGSRVFTLFTYAECGGLPMGLIITSSESLSCISKGFSLLKELLSNDIFGGCLNGPEIFITDDSAAELAAIKNSWPDSLSFLCIFHVLQSAWRWLVRGSNGIPREKQTVFYEQFRQIMYAKNNDEAEMFYNIALESAAAYKNYTLYLQTYWERRGMWVLCYRSYKARGHHTNNISESVMRLLKDKIFERVKAFNLVQLIDYLYSKFTAYYTRRLLDFAYNRSRRNIFGTKIKIPPPNIGEKIQKLHHEVYAVPSESTEKLMYFVDMEILFCTCDLGRLGKICKHIEWTYSMYDSQEYAKILNMDSIRKKFYFLATGTNATDKWLAPLQPTYNNFIQNEPVNETSINCNINTSLSTPSVTMHTDAKSRADIIAEAENIMDEINSEFRRFLNKSPNETREALENMLRNLNNIKNVSAFTSSCATFGKEFRKRHRSQIKVQPTAVSRRKCKIKNRRSLGGGRPRKIMKIN